jgi:hypothetical protein
VEHRYIGDLLVGTCHLYKKYFIAAGLQLPSVHLLPIYLRFHMEYGVTFFYHPLMLAVRCLVYQSNIIINVLILVPIFLI